MNTQAEWPPECLGGWAGGDYLCNCRVCHRRYVGDKRSGNCYPCAKEKADALLEQADAMLLKNLGEGI